MNAYSNLGSVNTNYIQNIHEVSGLDDIVSVFLYMPFSKPEY
jgi:hypothetical protein